MMSDNNTDATSDLTEAMNSMSVVSDESSSDEMETESEQLVPNSERPAPSRQELRKTVERHLQAIIKESEAIFKGVADMSRINVRKPSSVDDLRIIFNAFHIYEGGIIIRASVSSMYGNEVSPAILHHSAAFLMEGTVEDGKNAMKECIEALPDVINGPVRPKIGTRSEKFLAHHHLIENGGFAKRFESFQLYCVLCETHVKSVNTVLEHIKQGEHKCHAMRYEDRQLLQGHIHQRPPIFTQAVENFITKTMQNIENYHREFFTKYVHTNITNALRKLSKITTNFNMHFYIFGGYPSSLLTVNGPFYLDCYVKITPKGGEDLSMSDKSEIITKLLKNCVKCVDHTFQGYSGNLNSLPQLDVFFTLDDRAMKAVLTSRLLALYTHYSKDFLRLALLFRTWANHMGFAKKLDDSCISGNVFDLMTLFFMQKCNFIPIINKENTGMELCEFAELSLPEMQARIEQVFAKLNVNNIPSTHALFYNMLLFYGCVFDYREIIQITSKDAVRKDTGGLRSLRVADPITGANIISARLEVVNHLENLFTIATTEISTPFLPNNSPIPLYIEIVPFLRTQNIPMVMLRTVKRNIRRVNTLNIPHNTPRGLRCWMPEIMRRWDVFCGFCRGKHAENKCEQLQLFKCLKPVDEKVHAVLTKLIDEHYEKEHIEEKRLNDCLEFIQFIETTLNCKLDKKITLKPFGSLTSGFGTKASDLDLCVQWFDDEVDTSDTENDINRVADLLTTISNILQSKNFYTKFIASAKVPIVKFTYKGENGAFEGDISFSNTLAIHNTRLLRVYCDIDERVAKLGIALKRWAKLCGINDAAHGTLSSYALTIMMLHYLQHVSPPVIPCLQCPSDYPSLQDLENKVEGWNVAFVEKKEALVSFEQRNRMSVGELFTGFFDYYMNEFDLDMDVVQIRLARTDILLKLETEWSRPSLAIEDPFERSHNLSAGVRKITGLFLRKCLNSVQVVLRNKVAVVFEDDFSFEKLAEYAPTTAPQCILCGEKDHLIAKCPRRKAKKDLTNVKCARCNVLGHMKKDCKAPKCGGCGAYGHIKIECPSTAIFNRLGREVNSSGVSVASQGSSAHSIEPVRPTSANKKKRYYKKASKQNEASHPTPKASPRPPKKSSVAVNSKNVMPNRKPKVKVVAKV